MNGDHYGDDVFQIGNNNVGIIKHQGPADPQAALREMIAAAQALRDQLSAADREVIDESMNSIGKGANVPEQRLRRALSNIAGVATIVGQAGVPLIEAIRNVTKAFGM
jgi:hypothetical protein